MKVVLKEINLLERTELIMPVKEASLSLNGKLDPLKLFTPVTRVKMIRLSSAGSAFPPQSHSRNIHRPTDRPTE